MIPDSRSQWITYTWLVAILLLAMFLRISTIDAQSLWIDEGFTWNLTQYSDMFAILRADVHPPLYFLLIDVWVDFAGTSVFAMRYFSLLPSLLSVAVVYRLAGEIAHQRKAFAVTVALVAAGLMAIAEAETFLAQEARSYTWHVLLACVSMWGFLRWCRGAKNTDLLLWMLSTIALVYTFYLGAFVGVVQGLYALLFLRQRQRIVAIGVLVVCALVLLPWLLLTGTEQVSNVSRGEVIRPADYGFWFNAFLHQYLTGQWALILALMLSGIGIFGSKAPRLHKTGILLLLWLGMPLLLTLALNQVTPTYQPRRVSQIVPAIVLLTAFGLSNIQGKTIRWMLVVVIVGYGIVSVDYTRYKQPWRAFVAETTPLITPDTPMLFEVGGDDYAPRYHYHEALPNSFDFLLDTESQPNVGANILFGLTTWRNLQPDIYTGNMPAIINDQDHWWLFYWSDDAGAIAWLTQFGFQQTARIAPSDEAGITADVSLLRYDRMPAEPLVIYENGLILRHAIVHDDLRVELFWSTSGGIETDYTVSAFLLDADGQVVAQQDSPIGWDADNVRSIRTWDVGEAIYDLKRMQLLPNQSLSNETYTVGITVYSFDGTSGTPILLPTQASATQFTVGELSFGEAGDDD
ncbi:MAG: glycosyltransferase family 39 protein [Chloroflexota bacterium]